MLPPATPPPPRITAAAFASAAHAQSQVPRPYRRPTLHLTVVLSASPVAVLRHAHHIQALLSAKGFHVFLQTEVSLGGGLVPISAALIPDLAASSSADFFAVVAEQDLASTAIRIRLARSAEFVELPVPDLPHAIFEAWTRLLRADRDVPELVAAGLALNPNIVTDVQLDVLLQQCSEKHELRLAFTKLLRLVHITHDWGSPPPSPRHLPQAPHAQLPAEPDGNKSSTDSGNEAPRSESGNDSATDEINVGKIDTHEGDLNEQRKTIDNVQGSAPSSVESSRGQSDYASEEQRLLCQKALNEGLGAVLRKSQRAKNDSKPKRRPRREFSFCWLKRSDNIAARIMRSQLLARSLHEDLIHTFDTIAFMPVRRQTRSESRQGPTLPSEVHRQRLLREINDLLPRVEELGRRLRKRPRIRRRRRSMLEADPWRGYVAQTTLFAKDNGGRRDISGFVGDAAREESGYAVKCCACGSYTEPRLRECSVCRVRSYASDQQWWPGSLEMLVKHFQETINCAPGPPAPWVFAPGVIPIQPLVNNSYPNGVAPKETPRRNSRARSPVRDDGRPQPIDSAHLPNAVRSSSQHQHQHHSQNLAAQFQSMSVQDHYVPVPSNGMHLGMSVADQMMSHGQSSGRSKSMSPPEVSPLHLGTSATKDSPHVDFGLNRRIVNGRHRHSSSAPPISASSSERDESGLNQTFGGGPGHTMSVGSFSESEDISGSGRRGMNHDAMNGAPFYVPGPSQVLSTRADLLARQSLSSQASMPPADFSNSTMEELARGSYQAGEDAQWFSGVARKNMSKPVMIPGPNANADSGQGEVDSLQALAAASDAANGGTGSATRESLRAVSALVSAGRSQSNQQDDVQTNGIYNMF